MIFYSTLQLSVFLECHAQLYTGYLDFLASVQSCKSEQNAQNLHLAVE